jgi:hypothetical protein
MKQNRNTAPVFVVGCPRSGTTLLYDMLLSAGGFAVYLTESNVFAVLAQRFGRLSRRRNRQRLADAWIECKLFRASGLDASTIEKRIVSDCKNYGDFLRVTCGEIAGMQGAWRWADNTPEHILYAALIKQVIPDALFVHMIRDGRAVALSLDRRSDRGLHVLPGHRRDNLLIQGIYWEWIVRKGRKVGQRLGPDYLELRFERLLCEPEAALLQLGKFIAQPLSFKRIQRVGYRTLRQPNSSFGSETAFDPVLRWQREYSSQQLQQFEYLMGDLLKELSYPLLSNGARVSDAKLNILRKFYLAYFGARFRLKTSAIGKLLRPALTSQQLDAIVMGEDQPPAIAAEP